MRQSMERFRLTRQRTTRFHAHRVARGRRPDRGPHLPVAPRTRKRPIRRAGHAMPLESPANGGRVVDVRRGKQGADAGVQLANAQRFRSRVAQCSPGMLDTYKVRGTALLCPSAWEPISFNQNKGYGNVNYAWTGKYQSNGTPIRFAHRYTGTGATGYNHWLTVGSGGFGWDGKSIHVPYRGLSELPVFMDSVLGFPAGEWESIVPGSVAAGPARQQPDGGVAGSLEIPHRAARPGRECRTGRWIGPAQCRSRSFTCSDLPTAG